MQNKWFKAHDYAYKLAGNYINWNNNSIFKSKQ